MARNSKLAKWLAIACGTFSMVFMVWGAVSNGNSESQWVSWLFLPLVPAQLLSLFILWQRKANSTYYKFYLVSTTVGIISISLNWILYLKNNKIGWVSYLALTEIVILLVFVALMTAATMMSPRGVKPECLSRRFENLRLGVREQPAWTLMLFVILFLSVGYLFGFALGFHDQNSLARTKVSPALRMLNLRSPDDEVTQSTTKEANPPRVEESSKAGNEIDLSRPLFESRGSEFFFYFDKADAYLNKEEADCATQWHPSRRTRDFRKPGQFNYCHILALAKRVDTETKSGSRVRITLIGHSDNDQPGQNTKKYESNYELSQARAQNVRYEMLSQIKDAERWHNIEWLIIPASDEAIPEIFHGVDEEEVWNSAGLDSKAKRGETREKTSIKSLRGKNIQLSTVAAGLPPSEKRLVIASVEQVKDHITSRQTTELDQRVFSGNEITGLYVFFHLHDYHDRLWRHCSDICVCKVSNDSCEYL